MQLSRGVVVASIQVDLDDDVLARFRDDLLARIHETGSQGVILDVSGLQTLDSEEFGALRRIMHMTGLLGAESVLVGLQPGVVSALIETDADVEGLRTAIDLDAGFALLEPEPQLETEPETEPATAEELDPEDDAPPELGTTPETDR
jgi:rsbT antagonist protein RsbS